MAEEPDEDAVLDLLGDPTVRAILVAATPGPASVNEIAEACGVAPSTVYRHVDDLIEVGALVEETEIESDGSHHSVYTENVEHIDVDVNASGFEIAVRQSQAPSERVAQMWKTIRENPKT